MKNENIIAVIYIGLLAFSLYLSVATGFPYFIYFLIAPPILIFVLLPLLLKLGIHFGFGKRRRKQEQDKYLKERAEWVKKVEIEKKIKQEEIEKHQRELEEWQRNHDTWRKSVGLETLNEKKARKLVEERQLRDIKIKEENEIREKRSLLELKLNGINLSSLKQKTMSVLLPKTYLVICETKEETNIVASYIMGEKYNENTYFNYVVQHNGSIKSKAFGGHLWNKLDLDIKYFPRFTFKQWKGLRDNINIYLNLDNYK